MDGEFLRGEPGPGGLAGCDHGGGTIPQEMSLYCIRCGRELACDETADLSTWRGGEFLCQKCRDEEKRVYPFRFSLIQDGYRCWECSCDLTPEAVSDGRAQELRDVSLYLCDDCAAGKRGEGAGIKVGNYTTLRKLGGGLGTVYLAVHDRCKRVVAIKLMNRAEGEVDWLNFLNEVAIITTISHPGFVRFIEFGLKEGNNPFLVMEYVPGGNLLRYIDGEGNPVLHPVDAVLLIADVLEALAYLHDEGYVHLDVKPENILCSEAGGRVQVKIADFGLAANYRRRGGNVLDSTRGGTPGYMPREQLMNRAPAHPTMDVYAAGATLYHLLTGYLPLNYIPQWRVRHEIVHHRYLEILISAGSVDPLDAALHGDIIPIRERRRDLPDALCQVVDRALKLNPEERFATAREFREALLEALF